MVRSKKIHKMKTLIFIQGAHMAQQNYMHTGLLLIIEKHMGFLHAMEYYLITRVQEE